MINHVSKVSKDPDSVDVKNCSAGCGGTHGQKQGLEGEQLGREVTS